MRTRFVSILLVRVIAIAAGLFGAAFGFASATGLESPPVPMQFDQYIHRENGAPADPINLIFIAPNPEAAANAVHAVLGWDPLDGSPMQFLDEGLSRSSAWQMGIQFSRASRWHIRIENVTRDGQGEYVLAAIHRDDNAACGHVGGAFDRARDNVAGAFAAAGYSVTTLDLGNTRSGLQCDGSYTAGDGAAAVIDLSAPPESLAARR
ncbi:MAG TPA: hypothetical protein VK821_19050 [Dehalococcoidia bacterium]|nr:hypothetical protein [Dehalococcoidia bacterium]